jgi:hypothetical protein
VPARELCAFRLQIAFAQLRPQVHEGGKEAALEIGPAGKPRDEIVAACAEPILQTLDAKVLDVLFFQQTPSHLGPACCGVEFERRVRRTAVLVLLPVLLLACGLLL